MQSGAWSHGWSTTRGFARTGLVLLPWWPSPVGTCRALLRHLGSHPPLRMCAWACGGCAGVCVCVGGSIGGRSGWSAESTGGRSPPRARMGYPQYVAVVSAGASACSVVALAALCSTASVGTQGVSPGPLVPFPLAVSLPWGVPSCDHAGRWVACFGQAVDQRACSGHAGSCGGAGTLGAAPVLRAPVASVGRGGCGNGPLRMISGPSGATPVSYASVASGGRGGRVGPPSVYFCGYQWWYCIQYLLHVQRSGLRSPARSYQGPVTLL